MCQKNLLTKWVATSIASPGCRGGLNSPCSSLAAQMTHIIYATVKDSSALFILYYDYCTQQ